MAPPASVMSRPAASMFGPAAAASEMQPVTHDASSHSSAAASSADASTKPSKKVAALARDTATAASGSVAAGQSASEMCWPISSTSRPAVASAHPPALSLPGSSSWHWFSPKTAAAATMASAASARREAQRASGVGALASAQSTADARATRGGSQPRASGGSSRLSVIRAIRWFQLC